MPVDECMAHHSSTEFFDMMEFIHWSEWEEDRRIYYYLAQIAAEIRNVILVLTWDENKNGKLQPAKIEDMLLRFNQKGEARQAAEQMKTPEKTVEEKLAEQRARFEIPKDEDPEITRQKEDALMAFLTPFVSAGIARIEDGSGTASRT